MRRRLLTLLGLLLTGAAVNLLIAWGCAARVPAPVWSRLGVPSVFLPGDDISLWIERAPPEFGDEPRQFSERVLFGLTLVTMSSPWVGPDGQRGRRLNCGHEFGSRRCVLRVTKAGFPLRAFDGGTWEVFTHGATASAPHTSSRQWDDHVLQYGWGAPFPVGIRWAQFVFNTILIALLCWLVFWIPGVVRRRWRIAQGRCPTCGYPSGQSPRCPECGCDGPLTSPS